MTFETLYATELDLVLNSGDSNVLYTTVRRKQAINDAQSEFADLTECLIRQSSIACSCNTAEYALLSSGVLSGSTDFVRLAAQGIEYIRTDSNDVVTQAAGDDFPERPIQWQNRHEPGWRQSTSVVDVPRGYYLRPDGGNLYIGLYDRPDVGSSESAVLRVPYVAMPSAMSIASDEPFSVGGSVRTDLRLYHRALPHYAAYKLLPLTGDESGADAQLQKFLGYVARYKQSTRPRGGQFVSFARDYRREARGMSNASVQANGSWFTR